MRKNTRSKERGSSLLLALLALLLLTAIAMGMAFMSGTETSINANFKAGETAYFAARAGIEEVRDRLLTGNPYTLSTLLPTNLPTSTAGVLYVTQVQNGAVPAVTAADITNSSSTNPIFDDEFCHDFTINGMTSVPQNVSCRSSANPLPSGYSFQTTQSVAPYPLEYKWVRVTLKANNSTAYRVDTGQTPTNQVCWDGASEVVAPVGTPCTSLIPVANPVYLLTALAVTQNGARRLIQEEVAQTPTTTSSTTAGTLPNIGMFAAGTMCSALSVAGNAHTGSFNSSTEATAQNPPSNLVSANGNVGSNGNIALGGSSTSVNGSISTNMPATVGGCPGNGVSVSGSPGYGSISNFANPYQFPVPPMPNPLPPTTTVKYKNQTLSPGAYGNAIFQGTVTLTGGTATSPAVYTMNSLTLNGNANLVITGPVVINIAGVGQTNVVDMTGGSFSNTTYIPQNFVINYGGTGNLIVSGGNAAYAVVNAPQASVTLHGGSDFYGQILAQTINDQGGTNFYWDQAVPAMSSYTTNTTTTESANFYTISMRELNY
jgi:hypothetical protein